MEIVVGGGGGERLYSQNLRDFLSIKEEDLLRNLNQSTSSSSGVGRRSSSGLTLSAVLGDKMGQPPPVEEPLRRVESNRTLLDIIREDQTTGLGRGREDSRRSWRQLKDKIRLRRRGGGSAWPAAESIPPSDGNNNNHHQTATAMQNQSHTPTRASPVNPTQELRFRSETLGTQQRAGAEDSCRRVSLRGGDRRLMTTAAMKNAAATPWKWRWRAMFLRSSR